MKYFVVQGEYLIPFSELIQMADLVAEHRAYVQEGYDSGAYLLSGPQVPADSGIVIVRADSRADLDVLMERDPFVRDEKVRINRVMEFQPARHQPYLEDWLAAEPHTGVAGGHA